MRSWILSHDESLAFVLVYVGLSAILGSFISLFWLIAIVAAHGLLEWHKQSLLGRPGVPWLVLWELKLDLALVALGLVLALYLDQAIGLVGLGQATRAGVRAGARLRGWQRLLRGAILSADDAARGARALWSCRGGPEPPARPCEGWGGKWSRGDRLTLAFGAVCVLLILLAPWGSGHGAPGAIRIVLAELHPWPF